MKVKKIKENHKISVQNKSAKEKTIKDKMFQKIKKIKDIKINIKGIKTNIKGVNREETMFDMKRKKLGDKNVKLTDN